MGEEHWDVYDANRCKTGRLHRRGDPLGPGDHHLIVEVWTIDPSGRVLLTKRHPSKIMGGLWENTGGCVLAGEDSRAAAVRELGEEIGLEVRPEALQALGSDLVGNAFHDVWVHYVRIRLEQLVLQSAEVTEARLMTLDECRRLHEDGAGVPRLSTLLDYVASGRITL